MAEGSWKNKISNHNQLGGIETSVLDNGQGRGTRIAWVNTGSGLRYKIILDRGFDIAEAFYNEHSLSWISHAGVTAPQLYTSRGIDWLRSFSGGLLTTCGLTHVGGPESDQYGERGLHDRISNIPAQIEYIKQPDIWLGDYEMSITGRLMQTQVLGPMVELRRKISTILGSSKLQIQDMVTNCGNTPVPLMVLYHINFGWPLVDEGSEILWEGQWAPRERSDQVKIFRQGGDYKRCKPPLDDHSAGGEEAAFIDAEPDRNGICTCGIINSSIKLAAYIRFRKSQLPWLTNWQHWGQNEYVTALEPCTNPPIGQSAARKEGSLNFLNPQETRQFELEIEIKNMSA